MSTAFHSIAAQCRGQKNRDPEGKHTKGCAATCGGSKMNIRPGLRNHEDL